MVAQKTCTIILFLVCIQFYFSIQAVIQPADVCGDDSDPENKRHNKIDKVKNTEYMTNIEIFIIIVLSFRDVEVNVEIAVLCVNVVVQQLFSLNMVPSVAGIFVFVKILNLLSLVIFSNIFNHLAK